MNTIKAHELEIDQVKYLILYGDDHDRFLKAELRDGDLVYVPAFTVTFMAGGTGMVGVFCETGKPHIPQLLAIPRPQSILGQVEEVEGPVRPDDVPGLIQMFTEYFGGQNLPFTQEGLDRESQRWVEGVTEQHRMTAMCKLEKSFALHKQLDHIHPGIGLYELRDLEEALDMWAASDDQNGWEGEHILFLETDSKMDFLWRVERVFKKTGDTYMEVKS